MQADNHNFRIAQTLNQLGYTNAKKISDSLQGSVWRATTRSNPRKSSIIKVAKKSLHKNGQAVVNGRIYEVQEDICLEASILKYLSSFEDCPKSIVKFERFESLSENYYLVEEDGGGHSLFDFIVKVHAFIKKGALEVAEWQRVTKLLLKQMFEAVYFCHLHNIAHFDISLENFVITEVQIEVNEDQRIIFLTDSMQVRLCDFGLAEKFDKGMKQCLSEKYVGKTNYKSPECLREMHVFDAKKNDIWCLGVCAFMITFGNAPFVKAEESNQSFGYVISGGTRELLESWNFLHLCDDDFLEVLGYMLKYETERMPLSLLRRHSWFQS